MTVCLVAVNSSHLLLYYCGALSWLIGRVKVLARFLLQAAGKVCFPASPVSHGICPHSLAFSIINPSSLVLSSPFLTLTPFISKASGDDIRLPA